MYSASPVQEERPGLMQLQLPRLDSQDSKRPTWTAASCRKVELSLLPSHLLPCDYRELWTTNGHAQARRRCPEPPCLRCRTSPLILQWLERIGMYLKAVWYANGVIHQHSHYAVAIFFETGSIGRGFRQLHCGRCFSRCTRCLRIEKTMQSEH